MAGSSLALQGPPQGGVKVSGRSTCGGHDVVPVESTLTSCPYLNLAQPRKFFFEPPFALDALRPWRHNLSRRVVYVFLQQESAMSTILPDVPPPNSADALLPVWSDTPPTAWTIADVQARLACFPADRIRTYPTPGTATEQDVLEAEARSNRICELIDGTLVEKTMATNESLLAAALIHFIYLYLDSKKLGAVLAPDGFLKILPGQIRVPDVSFIRWERLPGRGLPKPLIYAVVPDLAIEFLSQGNTAAEMERKLRDYFQAGVRLVWYIEPKTRTARAYTAIGEWTEIGPDGSLRGGEVLPDFELPLARLFAQVEGPTETG